jgi:hypothetical protein
MADQPSSPGSTGGTGVRPGQRAADPLVLRVGASATRQTLRPHLPMKTDEMRRKRR